jgi:flagellar operon protein
MRGAQEHNNPEVSFSLHARQRLEQRRLNLSEQELDRLERAVGALSRKGGKLSLVLLDQLAMLVSIVNRRVITVAGQEQLEQNVFTNIDSAAVA